MPSYNYPRNNLEAIVNPDSTCDENLAYGPGSLWLNTATGALFKCTSNAIDNAVWSQMIEKDDINYIGKQHDETIETTSTNWTEILTLPIDVTHPCSQVDWCLEAKVNAGAQIGVSLDSTETLANIDVNTSNEWRSFSGFWKNAFAIGEHTVGIYAKVNISGTSLKMRRIRLTYSPIFITCVE